MKIDKKYRKALFIFRRDLRLEDNTGLIYALENAEEVIPCFIFTPEQIDHNPYRSDHCLQFMIESLEDLEKELIKKKAKLYLFYGQPDDIVEQLIAKEKIDAVVVNKDYTPYSIKRDKKLEATAKKLKISFCSFDDILLHAPELTLKSDGKPYSIFTPFYRNAMKLSVAQPVINQHSNYYIHAISIAKDDSLYKKVLPKRPLSPLGGRANALKILGKIDQFSYYESLRDFPAEQYSTHLSAHLKFTTVSPRETYVAIAKKFGTSFALIRSLFWRDFFTSIAYYFPQVFSGAFHEKYNEIKWDHDENKFKKWCEGKTGFPIVDAGMREMNQTGYMHNRVRMIVASFLVKDLHIDWRKGEKYFAQTLLDYDPAINNGNWQWSASTGCDAQPYFRIFNPWSQSLKFDPKCEYIKKWVPELASLSPDTIHKWHMEKHHSISFFYLPPMIDHSVEAKTALSMYTKLGENI